MERTISVWSDRNIRDRLWRWFSLTGRTGQVEPKFPFSRSQYRSSVPCFQRQNGGMQWFNVRVLHRSVETDAQIYKYYWCIVAHRYQVGYFIMIWSLFRYLFKFLYSAWAIASTLFSDVGTDSLPNSIEESLVMTVISPAPSSDTSNRRRSLEKWEDKHVRLLVESYLKYKDLFGKPQQSKKKVFEKIAEEFNRTSDVVVTGDQCFRKFKKLESKQKEIEDNSKTGREKKTWKFHKEMEDCMGDNPTVKPVFTFDTSWGSSSSSSTRSSTPDEGLNSDSSDSEEREGCSSWEFKRPINKEKESPSHQCDNTASHTFKRLLNRHFNVYQMPQRHKRNWI